MSTPVVFQYQQALDEFRREGREPPLLKRMSELISLLDLTATLNSTLSGREILDAALLIVMGELQVSRGALYVRDPAGGFRLRSARGLPPGAPDVIELDEIPDRPKEPAPPVFGELGLVLVCPVRKADRTIALIGLGPRPEGSTFGPQETGFLQSLAACAATPIENGLMYDELHRVNKTLSVKVFQLHNLFDIGGELTSSLDEEAIKRLVITTVMGHFLASRAALYLLGEGGLDLAHVRGLRPDESPIRLPAEAAAEAEALPGPSRVGDLDSGPLRDALTRGRFGLAVPLTGGARVSGLLTVGERASGAPFGDEDFDYALALARQAQAALEGARLHRVALEKERQDRELQIAQEIQRSLFPRSTPTVEGLEVAAVSRPCHQVGGDYYDFIPLDGGRLALVIADVSGKGTPASILMASVHASLRATAGTTPPAVLLERVNRFLCASTQDNKYVTLFYAEIEPGSRRLSYVNAGHIPPYLVRAGGELDRLRTGGPVLGLLEDAVFEEGKVVLGEGDLLATVTDGVTEALSPDDEEFGDARACASLCASDDNASSALRQLVEAVEAWTGRPGFGDDLTALIVRAR
ncbi:MAG: SpoIIE family protein phosphatase [Acidobacteria bacterium]|jgi:sigma-B regulation protein RsbU (phosphoserine phosphatase)|nr:SpoIIE family protein phosphatase [Acidobacteriota bacterium]